MGAPRRHAPKGVSVTEDHLRSRLRSAATPDAEKRFLVGELWRLRHVVQAKKNFADSARVLDHLRAGVWGSRHLSSRLPLHLGFKKGHVCIEFITIVRLLKERRGEWGMGACMLQVEFARAYDSIRHTAVLRSMTERGVPLPVALAYIREGRGARMAFFHDGWCTEPTRAGVGLHQGCSAAPMFFGGYCRSQSKSDVVAHLAWADDTWIVSSKPEDLNMMLKELRQEAEADTGLEIKSENASCRLRSRP